MGKSPKTGRSRPQAAPSRSVVSVYTFDDIDSLQATQRNTVLKIAMHSPSVVDGNSSALCACRNIPVLVVKFHDFNRSSRREFLSDTLQHFGSDVHRKHEKSSFQFGVAYYSLRLG